MTVAEAAAIVARLHAGQTDKQGRPYVRWHLVPVAYALAPFGPLAEIAGLFHDTPEDTDETLASLLDRDVPETSVAAVAAVTRSPRETYANLIDRSCEHFLGCLVKLADNTLNLHSNEALANRDPETAHSLRDGRYLPARARLLTAAAGHGHDPAALLMVFQRRIAVAMGDGFVVPYDLGQW